MTWLLEVVVWEGLGVNGVLAQADVKEDVGDVMIPAMVEEMEEGVVGEHHHRKEVDVIMSRIHVTGP